MMKSSVLILSVFLASSLVTSSAAWSKASDDDSSTSTSAQKAKKKKAAAAASKKLAQQQETRKKTVGELLRQADRGAHVQLAEKKATSLPSFNDKIVQAPHRTTMADLAQVKPPRTSTFMEDASDDKAKLERITDQQIQELFKLTQRFKDSSRRGELWLRLAELYVEKAGIIDFRKQSEYDVKLREFLDGKTKIKPRLDLADARDYNRKAIQLYEWFVRDYPRDEKMDQALFFLGYNYFELNETKKGLSYYTRLTKDYPTSAFVIESHFALGEYYFENENWKAAAEHYQEVTKHKRHRLYGFSTYKEAWCYFRMDHAAEALQTMERLIRENREAAAQSAADGKKVSKVRLEKEALRDIVLFYSDERDPKKAIDYFNGMAGTESLSYLEKLAYLYVDKGNREGARYLFNYLISKDPTNSKAFDYKYQVIQAFASATKTREFREELYAWVRDFGPSSKWYQANKGNAELIESSSRLRETTLKNWVLTQHQTAQNSHAKFSQGLAYEGYKVFMQEFPNSTATADMHFFFAELLYDMERFDEAGVHYRWVVENAPNSKYSGKAGENIVLALEREIPKDEDIAANVGKSLDPVALSPQVEKFVQAAQWYLSKFPQAPKAAEIKFRVGRLYYQHNQFDKAIPYFREIVQNYPKTKYADYSANLLLDAYNLKKDYSGLEKAGQELLSVPSIANSAAGNDIRGVLEKAQFKKAQDLEVSKDYAGSADQFEAFAKQNPTSPLFVASHFNAAINYERAGQNGKAISNHIVVLNSKAKEAEPLKPKSRRLLAKLYQDAGMLEEASKTFKSAAIEAGNDPIAPNLFYNAAILDEALLHNQEAIQNLQSYFDKSKKSDRVDAVFQMAEIHRRAGQNKAAADRYKEYFGFFLDNEKSIEAGYRVYDYFKSQNNSHDTEVWKHKVLNAQRKLNPKKKGPGASWAAKILLDDASVFFYEMRAIKIPSDPAKQKKAAQKKVEMLSQLNQMLAEVIKYDSPDEIIGSLNMAGRANQHLGEALNNAPPPAGLKPDELKMYKDAVQKLADPFFAKAKESFRTAVKRGSELENYGKEYLYAHEMTQKIDPTAVVDHGEWTMDQKTSSWMVQ
jgi:TolA-binding protein